MFHLRHNKVDNNEKKSSGLIRPENSLNFINICKTVQGFIKIIKIWSD